MTDVVERLMNLGDRCPVIGFTMCCAAAAVVVAVLALASPFLALGWLIANATDLWGMA